MYRMFEGDCLSINIYFDGSCKPPNSHGQTRGGIVFEQEGEIIYTATLDSGKGTNNYAEFKALWFGLVRAKQKGYTKANCFGDSTLVINAMNGVCNIRKPSLLSIFIAIEKLLESFEWVSFMYVKRNTGFHAVADQLSKV